MWTDGETDTTKLIFALRNFVRRCLKTTAKRNTLLPATVQKLELLSLRDCAVLKDALSTD